MERPLAYMQRAIQLARKGAGFVGSNPMVGAVLVRHGKIIAESYHARFGGPHAERRLIESALRQYGKAGLRSTTLYTTLEPCQRPNKKTPPCLPVILNSGIRRLVIGSVDPHPQENGRALRQLRRHGIQVNSGIAQADCDYLIRTFRTWVTQQRPFVLAKVGMTLDGKITSPARQRYITNPLARERVHQLRQEFDAIVVGVNTVIQDNPLLTTRLPRRRLHHPWKIILDSQLRTPPRSRALDDHTIIACLETASYQRKRALARTGATIIELPPSTQADRLLFEQMDLKILLHELGRRQLTSVIIEGGSYVFTSFINNRAIDEFYIFIAPYLYGATHLPFTYALQYTVSLHQMQMEQLDNNIFIHGYTQYHSASQR